VRHDGRRGGREGIEVRHSSTCRSTASGRCNCRTTYRAHVYRRGQRRRRTFKSLGAALKWRAETLVALEAGSVTEESTITLEQGAADFLHGIREGLILNRKGEPYKPKTCREYQASLRLHVLPVLGSRRLSEIRRADVQALVDAMVASRYDGSTIRNALDPLRCICRRALTRDQIVVNPCVGLDLPAARGQRDRVVAPWEVGSYLEALRSADRAVWATALYAGLRRGELRALRCPELELDAGIVRVERGFDDEEGEHETKSIAGRRIVAIIPALRPILLEHLLATGRRDNDLVFGRTPSEPFVASTVRSRAIKAWTAAALEPVTLHECRHTFVSLMVAAGVDRGEVARQVGHAESAMLDRYTHGLPGSIVEAGERLQAFLDRKRAIA
jgi:integrase